MLIPCLSGLLPRGPFGSPHVELSSYDSVIGPSGQTVTLSRIVTLHLFDSNLGTESFRRQRAVLACPLLVGAIRRFPDKIGGYPCVEVSKHHVAPKISRFCDGVFVAPSGCPVAPGDWRSLVDNGPNSAPAGMNKYDFCPAPRECFRARRAAR